MLDNFLINAVAADKEVGETFCKTMLSVLLEREIGNARVHAQRFVSALTPELPYDDGFGIHLLLYRRYKGRKFRNQGNA